MQPGPPVPTSLPESEVWLLAWTVQNILPNTLHVKPNINSTVDNKKVTDLAISPEI